MILPIVSLAVLFGIVASLGVVLKKQKRQTTDRADLMGEELGGERLPTDFGAYTVPIDLETDRCLFCGSKDEACHDCIAG